MKYDRVDQTHNLCSSVGTLVFIIRRLPHRGREQSTSGGSSLRAIPFRAHWPIHFPALEQIWLQMTRSFALQYNSFLSGAINKPPTWKKVWGSEYVAKLVSNAETLISFGDAAATQELTARLAILEASMAAKPGKERKHPAQAAKEDGGGGSAGPKAKKIKQVVSMSAWNKICDLKLDPNSAEAKQPCFFFFMNKTGCKEGRACIKGHSGSFADWSSRMDLDSKVWVPKSRH